MWIDMWFALTKAGGNPRKRRTVLLILLDSKA